MPNPANLHYRFDKDGKFSWYDTLVELEEAMMFTLKLVTTVVVAGKQATVKWTAELCFTIVNIFLLFPKVEGNEHKEQLLKLHKALAEAIAKDVLKLPPLMQKGFVRQDIPKIEGSKRETDLISTINKLVQDLAFPSTFQHKSTVVDQATPKLTPKAIQFDADGHAISTFKSVEIDGNKFHPKTNSTSIRGMQL